ncbi:hypothetical protein JOE44_001902 [Chryseobacterium sp. PvR013]|uniref:hypothetical protein n=1 Tax=Chryseobacterium sp. PvR013 TaxID=2806595 RepID=UPI001AE71B2F|nr:hypothetical protein [Chryseobacterium sp. PvR013]MBP1165018.1 hypothetical protein [Chryseobacterium sp. PvR013]
MSFIDKIPMYPPGLVIVFIIGFFWLLQIALSNERNKYSEEKLINDKFYIYPVIMMCASIVCLAYQFYLGNLNTEDFTSLF